MGGVNSFDMMQFVNLYFDNTSKFNLKHLTQYLISHEKNQLENTLKSEDRDEERDGAEEMSTGYRIYSDDPASKMQGENHESGLIKHIDFEGYEKVLEFILKSEAINGYIFDLGDIE